MKRFILMLAAAAAISTSAFAVESVEMTAVASRSISGVPAPMKIAVAIRKHDGTPVTTMTLANFEVINQFSPGPCGINQITGATHRGSGVYELTLVLPNIAGCSWTVGFGEYLFHVKASDGNLLGGAPAKLTLP